MQFKGGFLFGCSALIALCLLSFIACAAVGAAGSATSGNVSETQGTIEVTGNGVVYADPDLAKVTVGVITEAGTSTQAMADNAEKMSGVVSAVKGLGIPDRDIQTTTLAVEPEYASENPPPSTVPYPVPAKQNITGYKATNTLTVTVRDLSKIGPVVDAASGAGSNEIRGVVFMLSEDLQAQVYKQALQAAVLEATDKAKTMAAAAGVTNYRLKSVSESGSYRPVHFEGFAAGAAMEKTAAMATPVSPGEQKVQATVSMTYIFDPQ